MPRPKRSTLTLAIIAVCAVLFLAIAGPYLPGVATSVIGLFQGKATLAGEIFVTMQSGDVKRGADVEVGLVRTDVAFLNAWGELLRESTRQIQSASDRINLMERLLPIRQQARARIGPNLVTTVRSNAEGRYQFTKIPPGTYLVIAQHRVFDNELRWAELVTLKPGENSRNLTNSNAGAVLP